MSCDSEMLHWLSQMTWSCPGVARDLFQSHGTLQGIGGGASQVSTMSTSIDTAEWPNHALDSLSWLQCTQHARTNSTKLQDVQYIYLKAVR